MSLKYALILLTGFVACKCVDLAAQLPPFISSAYWDPSFPLATGDLKIIQCSQPVRLGTLSMMSGWFRGSRPTRGLDNVGLRNFLARASGTNLSQFRFCGVSAGADIYGTVVDTANESYGFEVIGHHTVRFQGKSNQTWTVTSNFELSLAPYSQPVAPGQIILPATNAITEFRARAAWREDRRVFNDEQILREKTLKLLAKGQVKHLAGTREVHSLHEEIRRAAGYRSMDGFVDGYLVTNQREVFFWELYLDEHLFLLDEQGRVCALLPK